LVAVLAGVGILALKYGAYLLTGSVALYSDALESIVNVVAAGLLLFVVRAAARPADLKHPFGHSKLEYLSAAIEGMLIVVAAWSIIHYAAERLFVASAPQALGAGVLLIALASLANAAVAWYLVRTGQRYHSPALIADGKHLYSDVVSSLGVLLGVALAWWSGWWWLDPLLAIIVALNIVRMGWQLLRDALGGLLDESLSEAEVSKLRAAIQAVMCGALTEVLEVHDLRTRRAGRVTFVTFHLIVPGGMPVARAHALCDKLEQAVISTLGEALVTIHVEPEHKAKYAKARAALGSPAVMRLGQN
jgi:cation diffusion facilitator family transporter